MIRFLLAGTAALALSSPPTDWDRRAADMLREREADLVRIEAGEFQSGDAELIRFLALYSRHKALVEPALKAQAATGPRAPDSLAEAAKRAEAAFLVRMRNFQPTLARLAAGKPAMKSDSALVKWMASYVNMRMLDVTPASELRR